MSTHTPSNPKTGDPRVTVRMPSQLIDQCDAIAEADGSGYQHRSEIVRDATEAFVAAIDVGGESA